MSAYADGLRLVRLTTEHDAQVRAVIASCGARGYGNTHWDPAPEEYPGMRVAGDLASGRAWGLMDGDELVCCAVLLRRADEEYSQVSAFDGDVPLAVVHRLMTAGHAQGRGVAARMMREMAAQAGREGARRLYVDIIGPIPALERFYRAQGFAPLGTFRTDFANDLFLLLGRDI